MVSFTIQPDEVLRKHKTVAVFGASKNPEKDANSVPAYLMDHGYSIIPINPTADAINGLKAYPSLADIPAQVAATVEVVQVFRPSEELPEVARQVVAFKQKTSRPVVFWAQEGLEDDDAKQILNAAGIDYIMGICMRTQHRYLRSSS